MHACMHVCMYVCMYVCMCIYIYGNPLVTIDFAYVHIYIYIHTHARIVHLECGALAAATAIDSTCASTNISTNHDHRHDATGAIGESACCRWSALAPMGCGLSRFPECFAGC